MLDMQSGDVFQSHPEDMAQILGSSELPLHPILVHYDYNHPLPLRFGILQESLSIGRVKDSINHIKKIFECAGGTKDLYDQKFSFIFQSEDQSIDLMSAAWDRRREFRKLSIIPDLYYSLYSGYLDILPDQAPDWTSRDDIIFWRGGTSGVLDGHTNVIPFDRHTLSLLPRYKLCLEAQKLGSTADVCFYSVAQTINEDENAAVSDVLRAKSMLAGWVDLPDYARFRYIVQIGGNVSSWGLPGKLRLGCCIFYIEGQWESWFDRYIEPWVHFVPVRADLSDFVEKVDWARGNPLEAETITRNARALGLSLNFEEEMKKAALMFKTQFS